VDAGDGWLIFALPPAEVAVHPDESGKPGHELYLLCDDIDSAVQNLGGKGVTVESRLYDQTWGRLALIRLPGGGRLGIYQPRHPRATTARVANVLKPGAVKTDSRRTTPRSKLKSTKRSSIRTE